MLTEGFLCCKFYSTFKYMTHEKLEKKCNERTRMDIMKIGKVQHVRELKLCVSTLQTKSALSADKIMSYQ